MSAISQSVNLLEQLLGLVSAAFSRLRITHHVLGKLADENDCFWPIALVHIIDRPDALKPDAEEQTASPNSKHTRCALSSCYREHTREHTFGNFLPHTLLYGIQ